MMWMLWLLLLVWGGYALWGHRWRIAPLLDPPEPDLPPARVFAVVPARNEANELPRTLPALLQQTHRDLVVVLVDDHSDDGTADLARRLAADINASDRLVVINAPALPAQWTGKVWAQQQGAERARALGAEWIWFTDADIRHDSHVLARLLATGHCRQRDLVSVMARLRCHTAFEKLLIPAFTYFFAGLYSFPAIGNDASAAAGAAGGCMLLRVSTLDRIGGMAAIRDAVIDDVALARACKSVGARLWLGYDPGVNSTRGYTTLADIWNMVARSAYTQLGYSPLALLGCLLGLAVVFLVPTAGIVFGSGELRLLSVLTYVAMVRTYSPMVAYLGCTPAWALGLPLSATLYAGMTASSAWRHHVGAGAAWKGRSYGPAVNQHEHSPSNSCTMRSHSGAERE